MVNTIARLKLRGKPFEILVDLEKAIELKKKGQFDPASVRDVLAIELVYSDPKKGIKVPAAELQAAFGTTDIYAIAARILKEGELQLPMEYKEKERQAKFRQVVDYLSKMAIDPRTNAPYPPERIEAALKQIGASIDLTRSADEQAAELAAKLQATLPLKLKVIRLKVEIPAAFVGRAYGLLKPFKEHEEWKPDGSLSAICSVPAGLQLEFFDKLNALTHGAALTQQLEEST